MTTPVQKTLRTRLTAVLTIATVLFFGLALNPAPADAQSGPIPEGVDVTLRNTLQDPGEPELAFPALFGQPDDLFDENGTTSAASAEFPTALAQPGTPVGDISGLYEINMTANSISFTMLPEADDPFWVNVFGDFPAGKFDRYYLTFDAPHNVTGSSSSNDSVSLRIDSPTVLVVEIGEGYKMSPPQSFRIDVTGSAGAPELAVTGVETGTLAIIATAMVAGGAMIVRSTRRFS